MSTEKKHKRRRYNRSGYYWEKQNESGKWIRDETVKKRRLSRHDFIRAWVEHAVEGKELYQFCKRYSWSRQKAQMNKNSTNKWLEQNGIKAQLPDLKIGSVLRNGNATLDEIKKLLAALM